MVHEKIYNSYVVAFFFPVFRDGISPVCYLCYLFNYISCLFHYTRYLFLFIISFYPSRFLVSPPTSH